MKPSPLSPVRARAIAVVRLMLLLFGLLLSGPMWLRAATAAAQSTPPGCNTEWPPCPPDEPPTTHVLPSMGTYSSPDLKVTIYSADDYGLNPSTWSITVGGTASVLNDFVRVFSSTNIDASATGTIRLQPGSNNLVTSTICDVAGQCVSATASYTYNPPPPPPDKGAPLLSLAPHNEGYRKASACMFSCGDVVVSYSTPAYISMDAPRSAALVYSSAHAYPLGLVQIDADANSLTPPERMSLKLKKPDGQFETFTTGTPEIFYAANSGTARLAAQFDARAYSTGAYSYTAIVRSWWGQEYRESTIPVRVLIVNEINSPFGAGWSLAGLQRFKWEPGGISISEGDGSIAFFAWASKTGSINSYQAPAGDFSRLTFDEATNVIERRYRDGTIARFATDGRLSYVEDRFGNRTSIGYDASGRVATITDPVGKVITFGYDPQDSWTKAGSLRWIRDAAGRESWFGVDAAGDLRHVADPSGGALAMDLSYQNHRLVNWRDKRGGDWTYTYDAAGKLSTLATPQVSTFEAGTVGTIRPTTTLRSLEAAVLPAPGTGTSSTNLAARVHPDSAWITETTPKNATVRARVNRFGLPTTVEERDPQGNRRVSTLAYDNNGLVLQATTPEGGSTTYTWQGSLLQTVQDNTAGITTGFTYEPTYDQVRTVTVDGTLRSESFYSANAKLLDSTRVAGSVTRLTYDTRGRVLTVRDPNQHQTRTVYETGGMQNTYTVTVPGSGPLLEATTTYAHDAFGRVWTVTGPTGLVTTTTYDALNRVTSVTGPQATTVQYGYADAQKRDSIIDPKGQIYKTVTNALGWVESRIDPRGGVESYRYDRHGNVTQYTNRHGGQVLFTYDSLDRVRTRMAHDTATFAYDTASRWVAVANRESVDTLRFDASGRLEQAVTVRNSTRYVLQSTYNGSGLRNALKATGPWGTREIGYGYDDASRLNWLKDFAGKAAALRYNKDHLLDTLDLPTGATTSTRLRITHDYSSSHLLNRIGYYQNYSQAGVEPLLGRRYAHDALARITTVERGPEADLIRRTLSYDALGRLTGYNDVHHWSEQQLVCPGDEETNCYYETIPYSETLRQDTFSYDKVGNRLDRSAVVGTGNRLTSFNGYTLEYDLDGNLTRKYKAGFEQVLTWNSLGQLTQVVTNGKVTTFGYDGWGRRVRKTSDGWTTGYLLDGDVLVMELTGAGQAVREYTYYPGTDRPLSVRRSADGVIFYYATEEPGHVAGLVNTANQLVNRYEYTPFGEVISASEQYPQPLRFTGREYDTETGLYYYRARYYDPTVGRFISEDPIGVAGGINPYAYVGNDPVNYTDPYGLCKVEELIIEVSTDDAGKETVTVRCPDGGSKTLPNGAVAVAGMTIMADPIDHAAEMEKIIAKQSEEALAYWAERHRESGNPVDALMGGFAALGTEPAKTAEVLALGWLATKGASVVAAGRLMYRGGEIVYGKNWRFNLFGSRESSNPYARLPHYHRRGTEPGQGIGRHRPWETKSTDASFWDRFE